MVHCSRESAKRFITLFLGINDTPYWFHQTLTFGEKIKDPIVAKKALKKLLDSLEKAFPDLGCFFVMEYQNNLGIHFHVIFLLFGEQEEPPDEFRGTLSGEVFDRWNLINGNALARQANRLTLREKNFHSISYLTKEVFPTTESLKRESLWWGSRNKKLIQANSEAVTREAVNEMYDELFPEPPEPMPQPEPLPLVFTKKKLNDLKAYVNFHDDWESFKKREFRTDKKVSDADYIEFQNRNGKKTKTPPKKGKSIGI